MSIEWPVKDVRVTGEFGNSPEYYQQFGQRGHNGIDIGVWTGTDVFACDDGEVMFEGWGQNHNWMGSIAGISIILKHWWGYSGYAHLSKTIVNNGQKVLRGAKIGESGATGVGTGPHLHFETFDKNPNFANGYAGRVNPRTWGLVPHGSGGSGSLTPAQRKVGKNPVKRRADATSKSAERQPPLEPGVVGNFDGWKRGERVNDGISNTDIWFRGISGDWFWAGGFTSQATTGLKDLNPAPPKPPVDKTIRKVQATPVRVRKLPNTSAAIVKELAANASVKAEAWVAGQTVDKINLWYKTSGGYAWAGGFTTQTKDGLTEAKLPADPKPEPKPEPEPKPDPKDVGPGPILGQVEGWQNVSAPDFDKRFTRPTPAGVETDLDPRVRLSAKPASVNGYNFGREGVPNHFVIHHAVTNSLSGATSTLSGQTGAPTAQYAVKDDQAAAMVDDRDTAATNTRWKSNTYGINFELCNNQTNTDKPSALTHQTTALLMARDALKWNFQLPLQVGVNVFGHKDVSKFGTECPGQVDLALITKLANEKIEELKKPAPEPEDSGLKALIQQLIDLLKKIFKV